MLSGFAPDGIVPEEFKLPSFNHVLLQRKDTKMYQVIFLSSLRKHAPVQPYPCGKWGDYRSFPYKHRRAHSFQAES